MSPFEDNYFNSTSQINYMQDPMATSMPAGSPPPAQSDNPMNSIGSTQGMNSTQPSSMPSTMMGAASMANSSTIPAQQPDTTTPPAQSVDLESFSNDVKKQLEMYKGNPNEKAILEAIVKVTQEQINSLSANL